MSWPDQDTWRFINSFAPWFSAVGSFLGVATALYLSMAGRRLALHVYATVVTMHVARIPDTEDFIGINVVNLGHTEANVTNVAWQLGFPFFRETFLQTGIDSRSSPIPHRLRHGDIANYYIPLNNTYNHWVTKIRTKLGRFPRLTVFTMKVIVTTSTGKTFKKRIERPLRDLLTKVEE